MDSGRRKFIKGGAVAAAVLATGAGVKAVVKKDEAEARDLIKNLAGEAEWGPKAGVQIPTCCNMCGGQCGIMVQVVNGIITKINPNNWSPSGYTNISTDFFNGYTVENGVLEGAVMCPKGNSGIPQLYDPDRVKRPLKRGNPDRSPGSDPKWQEISWEQALSEIAEKLRELRDNDEAHKLLMIAEDHSFTHPEQDFMKLFGSPNYLNHSNLCDVERKASFRTVMGDERPLADFLQSKYILLFGWNPLSAIKWGYLPRIIMKAIEQGAKMVVVDPYKSDTALKAHEWVPIRPSTDGAMALAMGHVIVRDGLYDREFVTQWSVGFDEYSQYVSDKTPAWAEKITSVPASTIERLAHEVATTKPAIVDTWSGPGQQSNGVQGGRAIALLAALVGGYDRPGTMIMPDKRGNKHAAVTPDDTAAATLKQPRFDELNKYPLGHGSGVYCQALSNLAKDKGHYKPRVGIVIFQNLVMSVPGRQMVEKALAKLELLVVVDTMKSETAQLAHYVLPGTLYLERYDLNTFWVTWPVVGLRQPVVKPIFGQPAEYETIALLGRKLGLRDKSGKEFFRIGAISGTPVENITEWYEEFLSNELKTGAPAMTLEELKKLPGATWVDGKGTRYEKYADPLPAKTLETAVYDGDPTNNGTLVYDKPKDKGGKAIGIVMDGKAVKGFNTPSRKVQFAAKELEKMKNANGKPVSPLPVYEPREWLPSDEYPLYLINWKEASHTHTRTQNNPVLLEQKPVNPLNIHPDTARKYGIGDGEMIWVESRHGKVRAVAKYSKRIHRDVVGLQHGFGHTALGKWANGRGTGDSWLRPTKADPLSGQALHKETCVKVYK